VYLGGPTVPRRQLRSGFAVELAGSHRGLFGTEIAACPSERLHVEEHRHLVPQKTQRVYERCWQKLASNQSLIGSSYQALDEAATLLMRALPPAVRPQELASSNTGPQSRSLDLFG
jgi:hypothetical protein